MESWLQAVGVLDSGELTLASGDASFRRYFRLHKVAESFIVMDAPPPMEDCGPFVRIATFLGGMGLKAPRVLAENHEQGFLLLTDLGDVQYLDVLRDNPERADTLYINAIDALLTMQAKGRDYQTELPPYDEALLRLELGLFYDWLCGTHLGLDFSTADDRAFNSCCDVLVENALQQPQVFVHRDFHSRNLMLLDDGTPGILDFQDAVEGPLTYDLVSLLKDCYIPWPSSDVDRWMQLFYEGLAASCRDAVTGPAFHRNFALMGVQRHLKAAGIFCRLNHRDGKAAYLNDVPQTLSYIVDAAAGFDELTFLRQLIEKKILPRFKVSK